MKYVSNVHWVSFLAYYLLIPFYIKIFIKKLQNNHEFECTIHIFTITQLQEMPYTNTYDRKIQVIATSPMTTQGVYKGIKTDHTVGWNV
jgi:hypothetical protein